MVGLIFLCGCSAVDRQSAAPAFADAARGTGNAFAALNRDERDAFLSEALSQPAADVRIAPSRDCLVEDAASIAAAGACRIKMTVRGGLVDDGAAGPALVAAADTLVRYADGIATAAAAHDLEDRNAALHSIVGSVGGIAAMTGLGSIRSLGDFVADVANARSVNRRRRALARVAEAADPAIQALVPLLDARAQMLRLNVSLSQSQAIVAAEAVYATSPAGDARAVAAHRLLDAAAALRSTASATIDFSSLGRAHRALIASLSRPGVDVAGAAHEIGAFADDAAELRKTIGEGYRR